MSSVNRAYTARQKKEIVANKPNLTETEYRAQLAKDLSVCYRSAKSKCCNISDSMKSLEYTWSKRSQGSSSSAKKIKLSPSVQSPAPKKAKTSNDEVACSSALLGYFENDQKLEEEVRLKVKKSTDALSQFAQIFAAIDMVKKILKWL